MVVTREEKLQAFGDRTA